MRRAEEAREREHSQLLSGGSIEGTVAQFACYLLPVFLEELNGSKDVSQRIEYFEHFIIYLKPIVRETFVRDVLLGQVSHGLPSSTSPL